MGLAPITEEDKPAIASMIKKLKRYRKREAAQVTRSYGNPNLDDAIKGLMEYGASNGWWEFNDY
jgi:hypothetical protein